MITLENRNMPEDVSEMLRAKCPKCGEVIENYWPKPGSPLYPTPEAFNAAVARATAQHEEGCTFIAGISGVGNDVSGCGSDVQ